MSLEDVGVADVLFMLASVAQLAPLLGSLVTH